MTTPIKWIAPWAAAAAFALTTLTGGEAALADAVRTRTVKAWDLDLAKPQDVQTLYGRLREAAHDLCRTEAREYWKSTRTAAPLGWRQGCVHDAVDRTVREIDSPLLATLHATTTRGTARVR